MAEILNPVRGKVAVVTGGGSGIGEGLARRFVAEGAAAVALLDVNLEAALRVAEDIERGVARDGADGGAIGGRAVGDRAGEEGGGGVTRVLAVRADVGRQTDVEAALAEIAETAGEVDIYCSNAGIVATGGLETSADDWQQNWQVNTMAHVYAAQVLIPKMAGRASGFFVITASAAGLLTEMSSLSYSVVKHGAVAVGEWLSLTYGSGAYAKGGVQISVLCPQGVRTGMFTEDAAVAAGVDGVLMPSDVADVVMESMQDGRFLVLPHPNVQKYARYRADDHDRWLAGMRRLRHRLRTN